MSQGTTKGVPIDVDGTFTQNSDQLVPSQKAAKTYVDASLSGKQDALYLNKVTAASSAVTGTLTETQCYQVLIPANTLSSGDKLVLEGLIAGKTGTAGTATIRVKISTSSTLPAGTTDRIADPQLAAANLSGYTARRWNLVGGNLYGISLTSTTLFSEGVSGASVGVKSFDPTVDNYVYVSVILANIADSVTLYGFTLKNF